MTRDDLGRWVLGVLLAVPLAVPAAARAQSTNIADYALLARDAIRATRLTVQNGHVGVTVGSLSTRNGLSAATGTVAAPTVHLDPDAVCGTLFANGGTMAPGCQNPQPFVSPFADIGAACGFPTPFPACNPNAPTVLVAHGQTLSLPAGVYGAVKVEGGAGGPGTLLLGTGPYTFCSLVVSRNGRVLFTAPGVLNVADVFTTSNASAIGPKPGATLTAGDVQIFANGTRTRVSRNASLDALYCGPHARFTASGGAELSGRIVAQSIRLKRNAFTRVTPSTTTTTSPTTTTSTSSSTTTSSTIAPVCDHDGVVDPGEQCDDTLPCHASSTDGAFLDGSASGGFVVCQDCQLVACNPGSTTTTTIATTTTTSSTTPASTTTSTTLSPSTTTTTLPACDHDGVVDPGEQCDDTLPCHAASAEGAFVGDGSATGGFVMCQDCQLVACNPGSTTTTTTTPTVTTTTSISTSTTTTPIGTTTTTTRPPDCVAKCGNGVIDADCGEQCDGSAFGGFVCPGSGTPTCAADCLSIDTSSCITVAEICDDCIDNDGNGLTDLEDPACCSGTAAVSAELKKGNFRARTGNTTMRLKTRLAKGFVVRPMHDDVYVQVRQGAELLCARLPAAKFMKRKATKTFKFWDKKARVGSARGISDMTIKLRKNGDIRIRTRGKHVQMPTPAGSTVAVTLGFRDPTVGDSTNRCASTTQPFRRTPKGRVRFP